MVNENMTGKPSLTTNPSTGVSLINPDSKDEGASLHETPVPDHVDGRYRVHLLGQGSSYGHRINVNNSQYHYERLFSQVSDWLQAEKARRVTKGLNRRSRENCESATQTNGTPTIPNHGSSSSMLHLEKLEQILTESMTSSSNQHPTSKPILAVRRPSILTVKRHTSVKRQVTVSSSDTEYHDGNILVPSCDVFLDNTKAMSYSHEIAKSSDETTTQAISTKFEKQKKALLIFKADILNLAHTLRLKGWRKVPLESAGELKVERLSGALTNAVYLISPPAGSSMTFPKKVLLRVYGPRVEHLIDREKELDTLKRLAAKKIGPRMLGTFKNGRFEEYLNAKTLTSEDLRIPDTSKQIAKRMRELHDGIELLDREREDGPCVWKNWDKWVDRCEEITRFLDDDIKSGKPGRGGLWRSRGFLCGDEWPKFRLAVDRCRKWLDDYYGTDGIKQKLVFAHNDTQYGNILRLISETKRYALSPLLLPANTHKQLVVIDFEYASANTLGLEFANHFTEWCYDYHNPSYPWLCETKKYPTAEEQATFIRSYVNHRPHLDPLVLPMNQTNIVDDSSKSSNSESVLSSVSNFDNGAAKVDCTQRESRGETETEFLVQELLKDVRFWRAANSAQWVTWGIIQAQIPELEPVLNLSTTESVDLAMEVQETEIVESKDDEFDYLSYASDRALFFWGDMVELGIVTKEELPSQLVERLKFVDA